LAQPIASHVPFVVASGLHAAVLQFRVDHGLVPTREVRHKFVCWPIAPHIPVGMKGAIMNPTESLSDRRF
jgi:hypothetical protein